MASTLLMAAKPVNYTVVYRNAVGDRVLSHVASFTASAQAGGFSFNSTAANLEIDLNGKATEITPTTVPPHVLCAAGSSEPCLLDGQSDKIRAVGSAKLIVIDCGDGAQFTSGLDAVQIGDDNKCGQYPHYISDLPAGPNGSLNWTARMNSFDPGWGQSSVVKVERISANSWSIYTGVDPGSVDCPAGDCAVLTRSKQPRKASGQVIEGVFHVPFGLTVTKP
jgi:hypothetical protein